MSNPYLKIGLPLFKSFVKICLAGLFIGYFHVYDRWIALALFIKVIHSLYSLGFKNNQKNWIVLIGMLATGLLGILSEIWGVHNQYWTYHDVSNNLPMWLPFAWMLAFSFIYKTEKELFLTMENPSFKQKAIITALLALFFPAFGEVITINLGVWTYSWSYQILGVPLYAILCLVLLHLFINYSLYLLCKKTSIKDVVFSIKD